MLSIAYRAQRFAARLQEKTGPSRLKSFGMTLSQGFVPGLYERYFSSGSSKYMSSWPLESRTPVT